jgi:hypothetical protein
MRFKQCKGARVAARLRVTVVRQDAHFHMADVSAQMTRMAQLQIGTPKPLCSKRPHDNGSFCRAVRSTTGGKVYDDGGSSEKDDEEAGSEEEGEFVRGHTFFACPDVSELPPTACVDAAPDAFVDAFADAFGAIDADIDITEPMSMTFVKFDPPVQVLHCKRDGTDVENVTLFASSDVFAEVVGESVEEASLHRVPVSAAATAFTGFTHAYRPRAGVTLCMTGNVVTGMYCPCMNCTS